VDRSNVEWSKKKSESCQEDRTKDELIIFFQLVVSRQESSSVLS
jgi:hypothetical protein